MSISNLKTFFQKNLRNKIIVISISIAVICLCASLIIFKHNSSLATKSKPNAKTSQKINTSLSSSNSAVTSSTGNTVQGDSSQTPATPDSNKSASSSAPAAAPTSSAQPTATAPATTTTPTTVPAAYSGPENPPGNSTNMGYAAYDNDYIYYRNPNDSGKLYKAKKNSSSPVKLADGNVICINVSGNWVCYVSNEKIYKVDRNGGQPIQLSSESFNPFFMQASGGFLYFAYGDYVNFIYKINVDNGQIAKIALPSGLNIDSTEPLCVSQDWIYCHIHADGATRLWRVKKDGSTQNKVTNADFTYFTVFNNNVYYIDRSNKGIFKVNGDGSGSSLITNIDPSGAFSINIYNDLIYYSVYMNGNNSEGGIFRLNLDGSNKTKLVNDYAERICFAGNMLIYDNGEGLHKVTIN